MNLLKRIHRIGIGFLICLAPAFLFGQFQLPDGGFESWSTAPSGTYEEPASGWFASLNALKSLGAPVTVSKDTSSHSGTYCAKLRSATWGTLLIPGLLVSGRFDVQDPNFLVQGKPFTDLPDAFQGWYKYAPVSGDSGGVAALLTRWNNSTSKRDTLAQAAMVIYQAAGSWTYFDLPFVYTQSGAPDSLLLALVSSQGGQNFSGQSGSTLWIDDISLNYGSNSAEDVDPSPTASVAYHHHQIHVRLPMSARNATLSLHDLQGRTLEIWPVGTGSQSWTYDVNPGCYLLRLGGDGFTALQRKFIRLEP
jgi:hypothetical protein